MLQPPNFRALLYFVNKFTLGGIRISANQLGRALKAERWLAIFCVYMDIVSEKDQLNIFKYIIFAFYVSYILR